MTDPMTPLEQAVEAMVPVIFEVPAPDADPCESERKALLAALDVLMPQAIEMARHDVRLSAHLPEYRYPDWPSLRDAITQETR